MAIAAEHPAAEYLEALYEMSEEGIQTVQARLVEWMGVSAASVSEAVSRLVRDELVVNQDRRLRFTKKGEALAQTLVRRHRLAEQFLIRIIGIPWHRAHEEAQRWEKVISDDVEQRLTVLLDDPETCPHGNPIPGMARSVSLPDQVRLDAVLVGERVALRRLTEDLELSIEVMRFLEENGLMPGADIEVVRVGPDGTMSLKVDGREVALGANLSDHLWVQPQYVANSP